MWCVHCVYNVQRWNETERKKIKCRTKSVERLTVRPVLTLFFFLLCLCLYLSFFLFFPMYIFDQTIGSPRRVKRLKIEFYSDLYIYAHWSWAMNRWTLMKKSYLFFNFKLIIAVIKFVLTNGWNKWTRTQNELKIISEYQTKTKWSYSLLIAFSRRKNKIKNQN